MTDLPLAQNLYQGDTATVQDTVTLSYEGRFLRRKRLQTDTGTAFVIDLEKATSLNHDDVLELSDGRLVQIKAARENVLVITGGNLPQLAWHIGNRHTPCQIETKRLVIQNDPVIRHMLEHLEAEIAEAHEPFVPEGGAYGHGRTHSHEHGHSAHAPHAH
ncbi:urease accessory protein UreE [Epibacterium ulvae]|uniref:urease accessory protein UreE n=1 Tax=Epibacterium ulvae TaxID=1156985 RepID=UPI002490F4D8|nr:urease accessory protein UreE [Epibacterium ulvae]